MSTHIALGRVIALTTAQRMLWTAEQLSDQSAIYDMAFAFVIHTRLDPERFRSSLSVLAAEADTMRMIVEEDGSEPVIRLLPDVDFDFDVIGLADADEPVEAFLSWAHGRTAQPINLFQQPFDTALIELGPNKTGWYFRKHHLFADASGFSILFRRLAEIYQSIGSKAGAEGSPLEAFTELAKHTPPVPTTTEQATTAPLSLYGWRSHSNTGTPSTRLEFDLGIERTRSLKRLLHRPGWQPLTTDLGMFRVLSTALFAYLQRVSGADSLTIGAPVHNRTSARHRRAPGLFTEVFPLTIYLDSEETFESIHAQVVESTDRFLRASGSERSSGAVNRNLNVLLNYLPITFGDFHGAKVESHWIHSGHTEADHHLRVHVADFDSEGSLKLLFDCNDDVLPAGRRERATGHFLTLLDAMIADPAARVSTVALPSPDERSQLLALATGPRHAGKETVLDWFADQVVRYPDRIALIDADRTWTYAELDAWATQAAGGLPASTVIGISLPRSAAAVLAILAVLKSRSAYVPIDPAWPIHRIDYIIDDAGCTLVIGERPEDSDALVQFIGFDELSLTEGPVSEVEGEDVAYVLYTSGSTGAPKGVIVNHSSLANYVSWAGGFYGQNLVFPLFSPLTFDLTVTSIFVPLTTGGSIRVYGPTSRGLDLAVRDVFEEDAVDIVKLTPSHLSLLTDLDLRSSRVSQLILGGEDLTVPLASKTHGRLGGAVKIHNEYGPTEATVGCIAHTFDPAADTTGSVPIGRPIPNMTALVLGAARELVPFGVAGHLWVGGASLSDGYLNQPELTAERFTTLPEFGDDVFYDTGDMARMREDGTIEYLGRSDDQVKLLGARVELGEVEAAVASHPEVIAAVATVVSRDTEADARPMLTCLRCGLPDNYPGIALDESRICSQCRSFEEYRDDATTYFKPISDLQQLLDNARRVSRSDYDCISLLSGGKDSTYALSRIVDMGAKPLAFTLDNGYISDEAKDNIRRVTDALGVDHVFASTPAMNEIFVDSLERHSNVCNGCFKTIYTLSMKLAQEEGIPLIVTGISRGQFFETRLTEDLFREPGITAEDIDARVLEARKAYHKVDDAPRRLLNVEIFESDQIFEDVRFADFYRYCDVGLEEMLAYLDSKLPWVRPRDTGRSTNCLINNVGIYVHKRERGFHNYALPYSWDVRMGHKTREEALDELDDQIDIQKVQRILEEIGYPDDITTVGGSSKLVAYYTSESELSPARLRSHAEARLPSSMVPKLFVPIDEIPMTGHGKADRAALPDPARVRPEIETSFVAPRNSLEKRVQRTWSDVLGIDEIGVEDNFFDLGGDSIMALRIVSRLRRSGTKVEIRDLFDTLTIAGMARKASLDALPIESAAPGPIRLSPMQHWLFETRRNPEHLSQMVRVEVVAPLSRDDFELCLAELVARHPALRQRFHRTPNGWDSELIEDPAQVSVAYVDGPPPSGSNPGRPFDLGTAPLLRIAAFTGGSEIEALDFEAHHLIIDAVSWTVLVDDLNHMLGQISAGEAPALPGGGDQVRDWVDLLQQRALEMEPSTLPLGGPGPVPAGGRRDNRRVATSKIDSATVDIVLGSRTRENRVDQILIAAIALSLPEEWRSSELRLFVEGHGRLSGPARADLSREIGWFTTLTPIRVPKISEPCDLPAALSAIGGALDSWADAADYGARRYLHPSADARSAVAVDYAREILFNYLGEGGRAMTGRPLVLVMPPVLAMPDDQGPVFGLEVNAWLAGGRLIVEWISRDDAHTATEIEAAASALDANLVTVCAADGLERATPARFPLAGLDTAGLGKLADILGDLDR